MTVKGQKLRLVRHQKRSPFVNLYDGKEKLKTLGLKTYLNWVGWVGANDGEGRAIVAYLDGKPIGVLRYNKDSPKTIWLNGTFVKHGYRHQGIGPQLWNYMIKKEKVTRIGVAVSSRAGLRLVMGQKKRHPKIRFCIENNI